MSTKDHLDYNKEVKRLKHTKEYIEKTLDATEEYRSKYNRNIKEAMEELDYLDSSHSYIRILVNSKFIEQADRNYDSLLKVRHKPYFARVDFKRDGSENPEKLYIGKTSLFRAEDKLPLIIDWRSPVASIYYEGRLGEMSYDTETGTEHGKMLLKRQFTIEDGELKDIFDIDITTNDAFLQASLDVNADNRLKDIAATIQGEQNKVIRSKLNKPLIVQGVAGSGKTTIALHRIAYLIYTYEENFDPDNFMIIAPNKLFINYISDVLPELGVEDVRQTTFIDFMEDLLGKKYKLINPDEKITKLIESKGIDYDEKQLIIWSSTFKGSLEFKDIVDSYISDVERTYLPKIDFKLGDFTLISYEELNDMFLNQLQHLPFEKRIQEIKKSLSNRLKHRKKEILKEIEDYYNYKIEDIRYSVKESEDRRLLLISLMDERDLKLKDITKLSRTLVKNYLKNFSGIDVFKHYSNLLDKDTILRYAKENIEIDNIEYVCEYSSELLKKKKIELEDYTALAYLKYRMCGFKKEVKVKNVVIDEAQDYSLFQFYVLKTILNTNMFTILGDVAQGIHSYRGINDWNKVIQGVFGEKETSYRTLVQSYRTTIEVMNLANEVIKNIKDSNLVLSKPVIRHGDKPEVRNYDNESQLIDSLSNKIHEIKTEGYKSIALICKTAKECNNLKKKLKKSMDMEIDVINNKDANYEAGLVIVPSYLAKGLEFDIVIIVNLDEKYEENEMDLKLLYVAMTRTLHRLYIYQKNDVISVLNKIDDSFYEEC